MPGADKAEVDAWRRELCKADLVSGMVGEFPELQGIMGRYYALDEKLPAAVADAIGDHYAPAGPNDRCPSAPVSIAVALADKLDALISFWSIGEKPTGSRDPYALRRAALGVIRIIIENKLRLPLRSFFKQADLLDFFAERLKVQMREKGVRHDVVDAVFALGNEDDLVRLLARVEALQSFLGDGSRQEPADGLWPRRQYRSRRGEEGQGARRQDRRCARCRTAGTSRGEGRCIGLGGGRAGGEAGAGRRRISPAPCRPSPACGRRSTPSSTRSR